MRAFCERIRAFYRRLKYRLFGLEVEITGSCKRCGACCRDLTLLDQGGWIRARRTFDLLKRDDPRYERFRITGRDVDGNLVFSCSWLTKDGCADYEQRMEFCRGYPSKELYFHGRANLGACGYAMRVPSLRRAIWEYRHGRRYSFEEELKEQIALTGDNGTDA